MQSCINEHNKIFQRQQNCTSPINASAIGSLSKIYKFLRHQNATGIMLLLDNNVHEKTSRRVKINKIWKCLQAICNLHSCYNFALVLYMRMYSFSTNQIHVIFSCTLLLLLHFFIHWSPQHMWLRLLKETVATKLKESWWNCVNLKQNQVKQTCMEKVITRKYQW